MFLTNVGKTSVSFFHFHHTFLSVPQIDNAQIYQSFYSNHNPKKRCIAFPLNITPLDKDFYCTKNQFNITPK
jgi:hypothetical protein